MRDWRILGSTYANTEDTTEMRYRTEKHTVSFVTWSPSTLRQLEDGGGVKVRASLLVRKALFALAAAAAAQVAVALAESSPLLSHSLGQTVADRGRPSEQCTGKAANQPLPRTRYEPPRHLEAFGDFDLIQLDVSFTSIITAASRLFSLPDNSSLTVEASHQGLSSSLFTAACFDLKVSFLAASHPIPVPEASTKLVAMDATNTTGEAPLPVGDGGAQVNTQQQIQQQSQQETQVQQQPTQQQQQPAAPNTQPGTPQRRPVAMTRDRFNQQSLGPSLNTSVKQVCSNWRGLGCLQFIRWHRQWAAETPHLTTILPSTLADTLLLPILKSC